MFGSWTPQTHPNHDPHNSSGHVPVFVCLYHSFSWWIKHIRRIVLLVNHGESTLRLWFTQNHTSSCCFSQLYSSDSGEIPHGTHMKIPIWRFPKMVVPPKDPFLDGIFHCTLSMLGYQYKWKPPYFDDIPRTLWVNRRFILRGSLAKNTTHHAHTIPSLSLIP